MTTSSKKTRMEKLLRGLRLAKLRYVREDRQLRRRNPELWNKLNPPRASERW